MPDIILYGKILQFISFKIWIRFVKVKMVLLFVKSHRLNSEITIDVIGTLL